MKRVVILFALMSAAIPAYCQSAPTDAPIKTTLCEIKAHPESFQHKIVEFRASASHGFEDSMVEDAACPWPRNGNPGVWMEFGGNRSTDTMYCCGFSPKPDRAATLKIDGIEIPLVDDDLFKSFNSELHSAKPQSNESIAVDATLQGLIFARRVKLDNRHPEHWAGYGHMGCCMLFVVTRVMSVGQAGPKPNWWDLKKPSNPDPR